MRAVVVGSGPNGLAAALTLSAAGLEVRVIEAADELGGGLRSAELTLPGLLHDECSAFHPFGPISTFAKDFELEAAGLTWRWAPEEVAHPLDGGAGAVLSRSVSRTATGLGRDGPRWGQIFGPLSDRFGQTSAEFLQPMLHVPRHPLALSRFGALSALPATVLAKAWKETPARALFAGVAAHAFRPLTSPFSAAIGVALTTAAHHCGWPVAEGGSRRIRDVIVALSERAGVIFETGRMVRTHRELESDLVLLDVSPRSAADILAGELSPRIARAYRNFRHGPGTAKLDLAVAEGIPWSFEPARRAGTVHVGGSLEEIAVAERLVADGRLPERPFVLVGQQYLADPSRSSSVAHPVYAYAHVPAGYPEDPSTEIIAQIERFAPGFRERILAVHSCRATDFARSNPNYVNGDIVTGANSARQLILRPRASLNPYATGVPGVYLCSAATPPGAGAHGMCGYLAAKAALAGFGVAEPRSW